MSLPPTGNEPHHKRTKQCPMSLVDEALALAKHESLRDKETGLLGVALAYLECGNINEAASLAEKITNKFDQVLVLTAIGDETEKMDYYYTALKVADSFRPSDAHIKKRLVGYRTRIAERILHVDQKRAQEILDKTFDLDDLPIEKLIDILEIYKNISKERVLELVKKVISRFSKVIDETYELYILNCLSSGSKFMEVDPCYDDSRSQSHSYARYLAVLISGLDFTLAKALVMRSSTATGPYYGFLSCGNHVKGQNPDLAYEYYIKAISRRRKGCTEALNALMEIYPEKAAEFLKSCDFHSLCRDLNYIKNEYRPVILKIVSENNKNTTLSTKVLYSLAEKACESRLPQLEKVFLDLVVDKTNLDDSSWKFLYKVGVSLKNIKHEKTIYFLENALIKLLDRKSMAHFKKRGEILRQIADYSFEDALRIVTSPDRKKDFGIFGVTGLFSDYATSDPVKVLACAKKIEDSELKIAILCNFAKQNFDIGN